MNEFAAAAQKFQRLNLSDTELAKLQQAFALSYQFLKVLDSFEVDEVDEPTDFVNKLVKGNETES